MVSLSRGLSTNEGYKMKRRHFSGLAAFLSLVCLPTWGQEDPHFHSDQTRIASDILTGPSMEKLEEMCDRFGARLTGTQAHEDAAQWAAEQFRSSGIKNVKLESITLPNGWQRGWAQSEIISPVQRKLHLESVSWTPSTPTGGTRGEVTVISDISEAALKAHAADIKDHIILFDTDPIF